MSNGHDTVNTTITGHKNEKTTSSGYKSIGKSYKSTGYKDETEKTYSYSNLTIKRSVYHHNAKKANGYKSGSKPVHINEPGVPSPVGPVEIEPTQPVQVGGQIGDQIGDQIGNQPNQYIELLNGYGSHGSKDSFSKLIALALAKGSPSHPVDVLGNVFDINATVAALGKELALARLGNLKVEILKQNGPLIKIQGLLNKIFNQNGHAQGVQYIELPEANEEADDEDDETYVEPNNVVDEPTETIGTAEPTETPLITLVPTNQNVGQNGGILNRVLGQNGLLGKIIQVN